MRVYSGHRVQVLICLSKEMWDTQGDERSRAGRPHISLTTQAPFPYTLRSARHITKKVCHRMSSSYREKVV